MSLARREFLQVLALAAASGIALESRDLLAAEPSAAERVYDLPAFGNIGLLHFTDTHAQLLPTHTGAFACSGACAPSARPAVVPAAGTPAGDPATL